MMEIWSKLLDCDCTDTGLDSFGYWGHYHLTVVLTTLTLVGPGGFCRTQKSSHPSNFLRERCACFRIYDVSGIRPMPQIVLSFSSHNAVKLPRLPESTSNRIIGPFFKCTARDIHESLLNIVLDSLSFLRPER